jgi:hypothetical protein
VSWDNLDNPYQVDVTWLDGITETFHNVGWISDGGTTHMLTMRTYIRPNLNMAQVASVPLFHVRHFKVRKVTTTTKEDTS